MSLRFSALLLLLLCTLIATSSFVNAKLPAKPVKGIRKLSTCKCRPVRSARRSRCYYFVNQASRGCRYRRCRPSYVCDRARGNRICRWKVFRTRIVKDGARTCKAVKHFTRKLVPVRKLSPYYPKMLKFSGAHSSKLFRGHAKAVLNRPHGTRGFDPKKCLMTYKFRLSLWRGYFAKAVKIHKVVLIPNSHRASQIRSIQVSAGGKTCTLKTRVTRSTSAAVYHCHGAVGKYVQLSIVRGSLEFCGIDAYGIAYHVKPRPLPKPKTLPFPKPYSYRNMKAVGFYKARWSGKPPSKASNVILRRHPGTRYNRARCIVCANGSWWNGYLKRGQPITLIALTNLIGHRSYWKGMDYLKVYSGGRLCRRLTKVTKRTLVIWYHCGGRTTSLVHIRAHRKYKFALCGVNAYRLRR